MNLINLKIFRKISIMISVMALLVSFPLFAGNDRGLELMKKNDALKKPATTEVKAALVILREGTKEIKEFEMVSLQKKKDKMMRMSFISPTRIEFLTHSFPGKDSDQWIKLPGTGVRRIGGSDRGSAFVNSHFYYADLEELYLDNFDFEWLGKEKIEGVMCDKIRSVKIKGEKVYSFSDIYLRESDAVMMGMDIYESGKLSKRLRIEVLEKIQGYWTARKMVMERADGKGKTLYYVKSVRYDNSVSETRFAPGNL